MSYGAGHIMDMTNRIKQNRSLRPSNRAKFKGNNREVIYSTDKKPERVAFKTVPENELVEIKNAIRKRAKSERKKERIFHGIFFLVSLIALIRFLKWMN